ncbi:hypothetical protein, partial [Streptomyces hirsutus]|uniref:hypothetical protein n=1 Tax=Streptomyces hirsutus TaxID=35620 RepID=UPI00197E194E
MGEPAGPESRVRSPCRSRPTGSATSSIRPACACAALQAGEDEKPADEEVVVPVAEPRQHIEHRHEMPVRFLAPPRP